MIISTLGQAKSLWGKLLSIAFLIAISTLDVSAFPLNSGELNSQLIKPNLPLNRQPMQNDEVSIINKADDWGNSTSQDDITLTVKAIFVNGAPEGVSYKKTNDLISSLAKSYINEDITFSRLQDLALKMTKLYRENGFFLTRVIIPQQDFKDGNILLTVIPGTLDSIVINNNADISNDLIKAQIPERLKFNEVIRTDDIDRYALLLNEIPGTSSKLHLFPGNNPGSTSVLLDIDETSRYRGAFIIDNYGNKTISRERLIAELGMSSLAGRGDMLGMSFVGSHGKGRVSNLAMDYSWLTGFDASRLGVGYNRLDYKYYFLDNTFHGYADTVNVKLTQPVIRQNDLYLTGYTSIYSSRMVDKYPWLFSVYGQSAEKTVLKSSSGLAMRTNFSNNSTLSANIEIVNGKVDYQNKAAEFWNGADLRQTSGYFYQLNTQLESIFKLNKNHAIRSNIIGMYSNKNVDSSQKLAVGGPFSVRSFDSDDIMLDSGVIWKGEITRDIYLPVSTINNMTVFGFYDYAYGQVNRKNRTTTGHVLTQENDIYVAAAGVGVNIFSKFLGDYSITWSQRMLNKGAQTNPSDKHKLWLSYSINI
ncbi:ShlB/FhaC/HecB family hemolysin secretion/activation protein [Raoultella planticola]|uniref:ShlB/FhaC/HecB family hemolysin secretion/activation protein n=1 Tax=Raoultella planticola TaxID=575 RepID=UPI000515794F|nr:ShlB/FhaC/HecB family hemolysin secretion/activation protein [Raoultella planticola]HAT1638784.1 ShlB/FhaC/HecB family hemolysin secretion/activation protein [Raoultella planticola]HDG9772134.1 ShlB/FhaC/HecB family hemolysin secretion/activation protein [Raoultella planticola]